MALFCPARRVLRLSFSFQRAHLSQTVAFSRKKPKPAEKTLDYDFESEAKKVLISIEKALEPVAPMNEKFDIKKFPSELQVDTGDKGWLIFRINFKFNHLFVSLPMSGVITYKFDPDTREWLSEKDGHDMRGMVTRDVLRAYRGCPNFS